MRSVHQYLFIISSSRHHPSPTLPTTLTTLRIRIHLTPQLRHETILLFRHIPKPGEWSHDDSDGMMDDAMPYLVVVSDLIFDGPWCVGICPVMVVMMVMLK